VPYARLIGTGRPDLVVKLTLLQSPPYLALLYGAIHYAGVVGAAVAWSLRAFVELLLFLAAATQLHLLSATIAMGAFLVLAASAIALFAPFPSPIGTGTLLVLLTISFVRIVAQARTQPNFAFARLARSWKAH
jgi:hypothetical protein